MKIERVIEGLQRRYDWVQRSALPARLVGRENIGAEKELDTLEAAMELSMLGALPLPVRCGVAHLLSYV